jgi:hypothetical protein
MTRGWPTRSPRPRNAPFAAAATCRWWAEGNTANPPNPGAVLTNLHGTSATGSPPPQQGAATSVLLAASPHLDGICGCYIEDCNEAETLTGPDYCGIAPYELDPENAARLWDVSQQLTANA